MALSMVTVTGRILQPDNTTPCIGTVCFTPAAGTLISAGDKRILAGRVVVVLSEDGTFSVQLPATDNAGLQPEPNTWNWTAQFRLGSGGLTPFSFALPASPSTVDLGEVARGAPAPGTYLVIPGPKGDPGNATDALRAVNNLGDVLDAAAARGHLGLGTAASAAASAFDTAGTAATAAAGAQSAAIAAAAADATTKANTARTAAESAAAGDATAKVAAHTTAADPHGDRAWASETFDAAGAAATALDDAKAYTDEHAGGGGGPSIRTAELLIAREIIVLPASTPWRIATTSDADGAFPIACSITAAAGDRLRWDFSWMRTGGVLFYDVVILNSSGGISRYSSTHTGTPAVEGYPPFYNQEPSFPGIAMGQQFTVQAGEIDGTGKATFALAYAGPADGQQKVYASPDYPAYWLLTNLGPEPS